MLVPASPGSVSQGGRARVRSWGAAWAARLLIALAAMQAGALLNPALAQNANMQVAAPPTGAPAVNPAAPPLELQTLAATRGEGGVNLNFAVRINLPRAVEDALLKGVPLYFEAEASLLRERWYWTDKRVARTSRAWRVIWQPLTRTWRVSQGGLQQRFDTLAAALAAISRASNWRIADLAEDDDRNYFVEFSYRLDSSQLPRPLQIGLGTDNEWDMAVQRRIALPDGPGR